MRTPTETGERRVVTKNGVPFARWKAASCERDRTYFFVALRAALASFASRTGCIRVFFFVEPATHVFGRFAESGSAVFAVAWTVILLAGMRSGIQGLDGRRTDRLGARLLGG